MNLQSGPVYNPQLAVPHPSDQHYHHPSHHTAGASLVSRPKAGLTSEVVHNVDLPAHVGGGDVMIVYIRVSVVLS